MYRIAIKTRKSLKIGLNTYTLEEAREKKAKFKNCIIVTEKYFMGYEDFKEIR